MHATSDWVETSLVLAADSSDPDCSITRLEHAELVTKSQTLVGLCEGLAKWEGKEMDYFSP